MGESTHTKWARFRFSVVGSLLACPPERGALRSQLEALSSTLWTHPITGSPVHFSLATIERWYYIARNAGDPVGALRPKVRKDRGTNPSLSRAQREAAYAQYERHRRWSMKLHYDNLASRARSDESLGRLPSYSTFRRHMRAKGLRRARGRSVPETPGGLEAAHRFEAREVRSFEATHMGALFHTDFHQASRGVLVEGAWVKPHLFGCLDDRSRLCCHLQWYLGESARAHAHGASQAFMKRGLPRTYLSDRGAAQTAHEITEGLERLGIRHALTLPYSPYQNGKQESFWTLVEGRLMAMLEDVEPLTLELLNEATQAWVDLDYNRQRHAELGTTPLARWLEGPDVLREAPDAQHMHRAFRRTVSRRVRHSDATISLDGRRFEVPSAYGHLDRLHVRYARFDLSEVHVVDVRTDALLCRLLPQDKQKNADGRRRVRQQPAASRPGTPLRPSLDGVAPLLCEYMQAHRADGLAAPYLPLEGDEPS